MKMFNATSIVLLIVGRLNWGLRGVFESDVVKLLGGIARVFYILPASLRYTGLFAVQSYWLRDAGLWVDDRGVDRVPIVARTRLEERDSID